MNIKDAVFRVMDCETTGFDGRDTPKGEEGQHRVIEIAYLDATMRGFLTNASTFVNPGRPIDIGAMAVHHITERMVADAPTMEEVLPTVLDGEYNAIVFHNAEFDTQFIPVGDRPVLCTLRLARKLLPDIESHKNQYLRYYLDLGLEPNLPCHRAAGDVIVTAHILQHLLKRVVAKITDLEQLITWVEEPMLLKTCRFGSKHYGDPWAKVPVSYMAWMLREVQDMDRDMSYTVNYYLDAHRARTR